MSLLVKVMKLYIPVESLCFFSNISRHKNWHGMFGKKFLLLMLLSQPGLSLNARIHNLEQSRETSNCQLNSMCKSWGRTEPGGRTMNLLFLCHVNMIKFWVIRHSCFSIAIDTVNQLVHHCSPLRMLLVTLFNWITHLFIQ